MATSPQSSPEFRRPGREDALQLARLEFLAGNRVDMQVLAEQLGIARGTLYRWVSSREHVLDELLGQIAGETFRAVCDATGGRGLDRIAAASRTAMELFVALEPLRTFITREPQLAVSLLMSEAGGVHRELAAVLRDMLNVEGAKSGPELEDRINVVVHIATSLIWVSYAVGDEPRIERTTNVIRELLRDVVPR
ncbi:MAG TPA: QsdR family transcriptional regulator [Thermoleophilaceae bacterium]|nr:QsdR family transcriptional regulator [Thermoleophilaceae bacterium]